MKNRIREIAHELMKIAAERKLREARRLTVPEGAYDEFCAGFPYEETEDQQAAIDAAIADLASGRPMDRLVCGDVGFGKTEVALRAAFVAAMTGKQVAVVVPTTLLARQHYKTFTERFRGFPIKIGQASRLVTAADMTQTRKALADGTLDIVVGTHALLGKNIKFKDLALVIVDEEQHFGVAHKEKLKTLRAEVHMLTLTATPIPRTLQLALTGVRDLSLIASPPVDRLAVRTFVSPFDPIVVREAILRERYRGGQSFYVCPRIEDLAGAKEFFDKTVPEVKVAVAHGQMPPTMLEDIMSAFYDGKFDVLISTTIVESGLDIPTANTLIVHRADRLRPGADLSVTWPGRALEDPRLCAVHAAGREAHHRTGGAAAQGSAIARYAGRGLPAGIARSRYPRRRQPARRRAVRPHQGSRFRTVSADAGGGGHRASRPASPSRLRINGHRRSPSARRCSFRKTMSPTCRCGSVSIAASRRWRTSRKSRSFAAEMVGSLRSAAGRGQASHADRRHQASVEARQCRAHRYRPEGRGAGIPRQQLRQSGRADALHRQPGADRQGAAGYEGRVPG